ncbi:MAG: hypothetical protein K8R23_06015 [Chthoniobacter sp.]|nr:hypothetical protein [Chthoniobacter sp.]
MNADSTVIKFACAHCGQKLSVDAAGAGLEAACPNCSRPLVVPHRAGLHDRGYGGREKIGAERGDRPSDNDIKLTEEVRSLRDDLHEARQRIESQAAALAAAEKNLADAKLAVTAAETARNTFNGQCLLLGEEIETLRNHLREGHAGRELLALRDRFETLDAEHRKTAAALARAEAEMQTLAAAEQQLRADLARVNVSAVEAERRAEAGSESTLQRDNGVLRGIIDRQKTELEERLLELRKLQRARLTLRIIYGLVALGLVIVVALTFIFLPTLQHLLHD